MNNSKIAIAVNKTIGFIQMLVGITLVLLFGLCTILYLTDKEFAADTGVGFLIVCFVLDTLGIWLIFLFKKETNLIKEFKRYVAVISYNFNGYIPDIAASLGTSEAVVKTNLDLMIKKKYFANAFIDHNLNTLVIANKQNSVPNRLQQPHTNTHAYSSPGVPRTGEITTVKCKACGGINTLQKDTIGECDYCGSWLKGE